MEPWLMVSTVGTSLLTNYAAGRAPEVLPVLRRTANLRRRESDDSSVAMIDSLSAAVERALKAPGPDAAKRLSAELNGIVMYYGDRLHNPKRLARDQHILLVTDTYQGEVCAALVHDWLQGQGFTVVQKQPLLGLNTRDQRTFEAGIGELFRWCGTALPRYREDGFRVVFNLVGGFKSVQGYMSTLGMLHADEILYIFEGEESELIRIPRLPISLDELESLRDHAAELALLEHREVASKHSLKGVPELLLDCDESGNCTFSNWGANVWGAHKVEILGGVGLLGFPRLDYSERFVNDFENLDGARARARVLACLAKVSVLFEGGRLDLLKADGGLLYEELKGFPGIGHFRVDESRRVTCETRGRRLVLRRLGGHEILKAP